MQKLQSEYVNITINLDRRDEKGQPTVSHEPQLLQWLPWVPLKFRISIIEKGREVTLVGTDLMPSFRKVKTE